MQIKVLKEYKLSGERNNCPRQPILWNNRLYVIFVYDKKGGVESKIQCLDLETFDLIWEYKHSHVINNILISTQNTLLASCMDGTVLCFDLKNNQQLWSFKTEESNIGAISNEDKNKIIFSGIQSKASSTWCLDIQDGKVLWKQPNKGHSYIPKIYNGKVYYSIANDIFCLKLENGMPIWSQNEPTTYLFHPKIFEDFVFVSGHGLINIYDVINGELKTSIKTGKRSSIREVIYDNKCLYFGDEEGYFYCYELTFFNLAIEASLKWKLSTNGSIQTIPAIEGENIFVFNDASKLFVLNKNNGEVIIEKKIKGKAGISGITILNDKIYFSCGGGYVYECKVQ